MLTLLLGRARSGKTTEMMRRICASGGRRPQVMLVPEQASHEAERLLCAVGGNGVSLYAEVLSFSRLASRVFSLEGGMAAPTLDPGGRLLALYLALQSVAPQLTVYRRTSRKEAFLAGLLATVDELKSCCVSPAALEEAGSEAGGAEGDKLRDLALICGAYEAMTGQGLLDPRDRLTRLADLLATSSWAEGADLYVDGFTDFTAQERQVLTRLLERGRSLTVSLTLDPDGEGEHWQAARRTEGQLRRIAKGAGCKVETVALPARAGTRAPALAYLEQTLFAIDLPDAPVPPCEGPSLYAARSRRAEVEWVAAELLALAREQGYRFREMGVAARGFERYAPLVEEIFPRYGVPVFTAAMSDPLQKPVFTLVTAALDTVAGGYAYDDVFRYLKTGLTGLSAEEVDLLENYVLKWDLRGSRWTAGADWAMHPRGYGQALRPADEDALARVNSARRAVTAPLERLRKHTDRTGRGQAVALWAFLEEIGLPERLAGRTALLGARGEYALAQEYDQLWRIVCGALEQCAALLGESPIEMADFARLLALVLSQYDVGSIPVSLDRVTAGEAPRLAGRPLRALFLLGADDGAIPQVVSSPGLLSDADRTLLADYGLELAPRLEEKLAREMTIVYTACAQPTERLTISWARTGEEGAALRPSFLAGRLQTLFPDLAVEEEDADGGFRRAAPRPALAQAGQNAAVREALAALPDYAPLVARLERVGTWERGSLSRDAARALYGAKVPMSASRMDLFEACRFSYFMRYGLRAQPRAAAGFDAVEYGTFVHYVLERAFAAGKRPDEARLRAVVGQYVADELGGLDGQTPRFRYLFHRLARSVGLVVDNVADELDASAFSPLAFELGFGMAGGLPPLELERDGVTVSVSGVVDRVDGFEKDGRLYLRVVDYKTGRKSFDLTEIYNGMGLQMLLYLFTLQERGEALYGRETVPAGALYLPAREVIVAGSRDMSEGERRKKVDAELRRRGILLSDPEVLAAMERAGEEGLRFLPATVGRDGGLSGEALVSAERFGALKAHLDRTLAALCAELAAGYIDANPYWRGAEKNACRWCDYAAACHFEEGLGKDRRRWLPTLDGERFWTLIETDETDEGEDGEQQ